MQQLQWNYQSEVATLFPNHQPIQTLCKLIDRHQATGKKANDLKEQLLQWVQRDGTYQQWNEAVSYIKGGF